MNNSRQYQEAKAKLKKAVDLANERMIPETIHHLADIDAENLIAETFKVDFSKGINMSEVDDRRRNFGSNQFDQPPRQPSFSRAFLDVFKDYVLLFLLAVSVLSITYNFIFNADNNSTEWLEGGSIIAIILISALMQALRSVEKEKAFQQLNSFSTHLRTTMVVRDSGIRIEIGQYHVIPGDIILIEAGNVIPADAFILECHDLTVDESALTGELEAVEKDTLANCRARKDMLDNSNTPAEDRIKQTQSLPSPILFAGTKVVSGSGKCVAILVGADCKIGQLVDSENSTPLQMRLETLVNKAEKYVYLSAGVIMLVLIGRSFLEGMLNGQGRWIELVHSLIIVATIALVANPETLPLVAALSLSRAIPSLMVENILVKKAEACENLGRVDTICVDKTGALTSNKVQLVGFWNEAYMAINPYKSEDIFASTQHGQFKNLFLQACICNNSTEGSPTESALLEYARKMGMSVSQYKRDHAISSSMVFPFTSKRKRMSAIIENVSSGLKGNRRLHTKGAAEQILASCSHIFLKNDEIISISPQKRAGIEDALRQIEGEGLRVMGIAYRDIENGDNLETVDDHGLLNVEKEGLTLIGFLALSDPLRVGVKEAVSRLREAGIKVIMATHDLHPAATAIAKESGILTGEIEDSILDGGEFRSRVGRATNGKIQNKREFSKIVRNLEVLVRARAEDKYTLMAGLQEMDRVIAVTGDGTADLPTIKKADVGIALGISSTDAVKEAADLIILDDNFRSILAGVLWGRNIYATTKKYLQFLFTTNIVLVVLTIIGSVLYGMAIITPVQMLWVNLVVDIAAGTAFTLEKPDPKLLQKRSRDAILTNGMIKFILVHSIYQLVVTLVLTCLGDQFIPEQSRPEDNGDGIQPQIRYSPHGNGSQYVISGRLYHIDGSEDYYPYQEELGSSRHMTVVFNTFVFMQIFNLFNARKLGNSLNIFEGLRSNRWFVGSVILLIVLQVLLGTFGGRAFSVFRDGMTLPQWGITIAFGLGEWIVGALSKLVPKKIRENSTREQDYTQLRDEPELELAMMGNPKNSITTQ